MARKPKISIRRVKNKLVVSVVGENVDRVFGNVSALEKFFGIEFTAMQVERGDSFVSSGGYISSGISDNDIHQNDNIMDDDIDFLGKLVS